MGGQTDGRADGQTDGRTDERTDGQIPPVFYRTPSPLGPLPKKEKKFKWFSTVFHLEMEMMKPVNFWRGFAPMFGL